jgi:hypothetical protein
MTEGRLDYQTLVGVDIFELNQRALKSHMKQLLAERRRLKQSVVPSVSECDNLLALCQAEINSRSSSKIAYAAIIISVVSIVTSLII